MHPAYHALFTHSGVAICFALTTHAAFLGLWGEASLSFLCTFVALVSVAIGRRTEAER